MEASKQVTVFPYVPEAVRVEAKSIMTIDQYFLSLEVQSVILGVLALFGIITNIINIKTFIAMSSFSGGINLTFLYLSVSDLLVCCCSVFIAFCSYFVSYEARWFPQPDPFKPAISVHTGFFFPVDPTYIGIFAQMMVQLFNITTISITVYLAVARCLCVLRPLKFRNALTARKTTLFVCAALFLSLTSRLPVMSQTGIATMFNPRFNATRPTIFLTAARTHIKDITWLSVDMTCCLGAQISVLICIAIMLKSLRAAAKFRASNLKAGGATSLSKPESTSDQSKESNTKENRVAKQMLLVSTIFVVCNTPKVVCYLTTNINSGFDMGSRYHFLYQTSMMLNNVFDTLNSSVNILVYIQYNTKFRRTLLGKQLQQ